VKNSAPCYYFGCVKNAKGIKRMNEEKNSKAKTPILKFFSNPLVGIIGTTASIIGVILAVIFYIQGRERRKLMFLENPGKAIIAKVGHSSKIEILIEGKQIKSDVTAAQVAFWNEGKKSIRPENILRPLIIKTTDKIPIVEAKIRKKSREIIGIDLDQSKKNEGEIKISWNILEKNDGAIIQITYLGSPEVTIIANAIIEGQGEIEANSENQLKKQGMKFQSFIILILIIVFQALFAILYAASKFGGKNYRMIRVARSLSIIIIVLGYAYLIIKLLTQGLPTPPFDF
jgi:hypothetical protein